MKAILIIVWVISMIAEMAAFFNYFHKLHTGETVFYTGSYLDMKSSIAGKDFNDALRVTAVLNIALFLAFKLLGWIFIRLLNLVLIVLHFVLFYGGILLCIYFVWKYIKTKQGEKQILAAVAAIVLGFLMGFFQGKVSTQIKMDEGGGDLSYEERVEAYGFSVEDAAFMEGYSGWQRRTVLQAMSDKIFAGNLESERKSYESSIESRKTAPIDGVEYRTPEMVIAQEGAVVYDGPGDSYEQLGVVPYHVGVGKIDPYEEIAGTYDESEWMYVRWWNDEGISNYESYGWIRVKDVKEIS